MNRPLNLPTAIANPIPIRYRAQDRIIHTNEQPFCDETLCPCHADMQAHDREIMQPWLNGLLTEVESARIFYGKQV